MSSTHMPAKPDVYNIHGRPVTVHGSRSIAHHLPVPSKKDEAFKLLVQERENRPEERQHTKDKYIHKIASGRYTEFLRNNGPHHRTLTAQLHGVPLRPNTTNVARGRSRAMRYKFLKYLLENEGEDDVEIELEAIDEGQVSERPQTGSQGGWRVTPGRFSSRAVGAADVSVATPEIEIQTESVADRPGTATPLPTDEETKTARRKGLWKKLSMHTLQQFGRNKTEAEVERPSSSAETPRGVFGSIVNRIRKKSRVRKAPAEKPDLDVLAALRALEGPRDPPMARFRRAARLVQLVLTAIRSQRRENQRREAKLMSFYHLQDDIGTTRYGKDLDFDPNYYRACRQIQISDVAKQILIMDPKDRNDEQRHISLVSLNQSVDAFGEFPIKMQQSLVRRGWYEHFEAKRVIIRQGHFAENFYFILSGIAVVSILTTNKKTGETSNNTVAFLKKGNSFGELALMYGGTRNATVTCKDDVELLAVSREDFVDIFMHVDKDVEPDHIQFLRRIDFFDGWPIEELPYADPKICLFTYFRRGVIMCRDSITSEWIYVVKTGTCRVLKALQPVKADMMTMPSELRGSTNSLQGTPQNSPRKNNSQKNGLTSPANSNRIEIPKLNNQRLLPALKGVDHKAAKESRQEHKANIDKLHDERYKPKQRAVTFEKPKAKPKPNAKVYVQIQKLGPKETFGLTSVAFQMMEEPMSLILVSDGAECVLINKKFFLQHLSEGHHKYLRKSLQPYPTEDHLQQKLQDQVNWEAYKAVTFQKEFIYNKKLNDTLLL